MEKLFSDDILFKFVNATEAEFLKLFATNVNPVRSHTATPSLVKWCENTAYVRFVGGATYFLFNTHEQYGAVGVIMGDLVSFYIHRDAPRQDINWGLMRGLFMARRHAGLDIRLESISEEREVCLCDVSFFIVRDFYEMKLILTEAGADVIDLEEPVIFPRLLRIQPEGRGLMSAPRSFQSVPWQVVDTVAFNVRHAQEIKVTSK